MGGFCCCRRWCFRVEVGYFGFEDISSGGALNYLNMVMDLDNIATCVDFNFVFKHLENILEGKLMEVVGMII